MTLSHQPFSALIHPPPEERRKGQWRRKEEGGKEGCYCLPLPHYFKGEDERGGKKESVLPFVKGQSAHQFSKRGRSDAKEGKGCCFTFSYLSWRHEEGKKIKGVVEALLLHTYMSVPEMMTRRCRREERRSLFPFTFLKHYRNKQREKTAILFLIQFFLFLFLTQDSKNYKK